MFAKNGFKVTLDVHTSIQYFKFESIIKEVENRDMSQLTLISEREYSAGLERIRSDSLRMDGFIGDIAFLDLYAETIS